MAARGAWGLRRARRCALALWAALLLSAGSWRGLRGPPVPREVAADAACFAGARGEAAGSAGGRAAGATRRHATDGINSWQVIMQEMQRKSVLAEAREEALEVATPVPESLEQAASWAAQAVLAAREEGVAVQAMLCSIQGEEEGSLLSEGVDFSELLVREFVALGATSGIGVRVIFGDADTASQCAKAWEPLPPSVALGHLPEGVAELPRLLDAPFVIVVAPVEAEMPAVAALAGLAATEKATLIVVNAEPGQGPAEAAMNCTFHMQQVVVQDLDGSPLNPAIITRAWPRRFATWEDNPDDPDADNGYYFLQVHEDAAPSTREVRVMLATSKANFKERCKWKR